jgi:hypothetical protein
MKVIVNLPLLSFYEPVALAEFVVADILAQIERLKNFLGFKVLLMTTDVNDHRTLTAVAFNNPEQLRTYSLLGILIEPMSFLFHGTEFTSMLVRVGFQLPLESHIWLNEHSCLFYFCQSQGI